MSSDDLPEVPESSFDVDMGLDDLIDDVVSTVDDEVVNEAVSRYSRSQVDTMLVELINRYMEVMMRMDLVDQSMEMLATAMDGDTGEVAETLNDMDREEKAKQVRRESGGN